MLSYSIFAAVASSIRPSANAIPIAFA